MSPLDDCGSPILFQGWGAILFNPAVWWLSIFYVSGLSYARAEQEIRACGWISLPSIALYVALTFPWSSQGPNWEVLLVVCFRRKQCKEKNKDRPVIMHVNCILQNPPSTKTQKKTIYQIDWDKNSFGRFAFLIFLVISKVLFSNI